MNDFRQNTIRGISWSVVGSLSNQALVFTLSIVLARLLSPAEFGLVSMVMIFTGFAKLFQDVGLGSALVQHQDVEERHRSSVFWVNVLSGTLLTGIFFVAAPWIAQFYNEPSLTPIAAVMSVQFVLGGLSNVHQTILQKEIDFRTLSLVQVGSTILAGGTSIALAVNGFGVWSLVTQVIVGASARTLALWVVSAWTPRFVFSRSALSDLWRFSLNLLGSQSLGFWVRRLDDLLIGRFLGSSALGIYTKAYGIMLLPLRSISGVLGRVMFPSLSAIQDDVPRVRRIYLRMTRTISLFSFPLMLGLFATTEPFVLGIFGQQWSGMIAPLQIFCFTGLAQSISTLNGNLYLSQGRSDLQFRVVFFTRTILMIGISVGLYWGLMGIVIGYSSISILNAYITFRFAGGLVGLTFSKLVRELSGVFSCAALMSALVWLLGMALPPTWQHWLTLLTQVSTGVLLYWGFVYGFGVQAYQETVDLLSEQIQKRRAA